MQALGTTPTPGILHTMARQYKIIGVAIGLLVLLGALTWKSIGTAYLLWYYNSQLCPQLGYQCDTTLSEIADITPAAAMASTTIVFNGVTIPVPFVIATSSVSADTATFDAGPQPNGVARRQLVAFASGYEITPTYTRTTETVLEMVNGEMISVERERDFTPFEALAKEYVEEAAAADPSHYQFLRDTITFDRRNISYFAGLSEKVRQFIHLNEKATLPSNSAYEFTLENKKGFVFATPNPNTGNTIYTLYIFNTERDEKITIILWSVSAEEMRAVLEDVQFGAGE